MFWFKKITIPNGETKELIAYEKWSVRWEGAKGPYSTEIQGECEFFTNEQDAKDFADELGKAFKLVRHWGKYSIRVSKE